MFRNIYTLDGRQLSERVSDEVLDQSLAVARQAYPDVFQMNELQPRSATFHNAEKFSINIRTWDGTRAVTNAFNFTVQPNGAISLDGFKTY